jgi:hypothetical protein
MCPTKVFCICCSEHSDLKSWQASYTSENKSLNNLNLRVLLKILKERDHSEDLGRDGKILKWCMLGK